MNRWVSAAALALAIIAVPAAVAASATTTTVPLGASFDATLTPGAVDAAVTQASLAATICKVGFAKTVKALSAATMASVYSEYHITKTQRSKYVIDHLVPLELGGSNEIANLWPQAKSEVKQKDVIEAQLHASVCGGKLQLASVQAAIAADWRNAPTAAVILTTQQIAPALLALQDMPTGWSFVPTDPANLQPSATDGFCNGPNLLARAQAAGGVGSGYTGFTVDPKSGPSIGEYLLAFPSAKAAQGLLQTSSDAASKCTSFDVAGATAGVTNTTTVSQLSFPNLGDQVVAIRALTTPRTTIAGSVITGVSGELDTIYTRKGNHVMVVSRSGLSADIGQLQTYVQMALDKLGVALQSAAQASR